MARERELKFDIEAGGAGRIARLEPLAGTTPARSDYETLYFDTADGALRRAGFSLIIRRSGDRYVQTIKRKKASSAGLFDRQEWEEEVPDFTLRAEVLKRSALKRWATKAESGEIVPAIRSTIARSAWQVRHRGSRIEVVLDQGRIGNGVEADVDELELELIRGRATALFDLAGRFAEKVPLRLGVLSKSERGFALSEGRLGHATKAEPTALDSGMSEGDAFRAIAFACLRHVRLNEIVLLERQDAEALHQARVALRRLRSALPLFRKTVRDGDHKRLRGELRWFARHFGDARNLDLLLERLDSAGHDEDLLAPLREAHEKAHRRVTRALRSKRARTLFLHLVRWLETGAWRGGLRAGRPITGLAMTQLERRWKRVLKRARDFDSLDAPARHALRIAVKEMRYSAEFLAPLHATTPAALRR